MPRRRMRWLWTSWAVLCVSVIGAATFGAAWRASVESQQRHAFDAEAVGVASTVGTALRRMDDLVVTARTTVQQNPTMTNRQFNDWALGLDTSNRYAGTLGLGYVQPVTYAGLQQFGDLVRADGDFAASLPKGPFTPIPAGRRASYCFARLVTSVPGGVGTPVNFDICSLGDTFSVARDTGQFTVLDLRALIGGGVFAMIAPMYRGGVVPATLAERRRLIVGWMSAMIDSSRFLGVALADHPGFGVNLVRQDLTGAQLNNTLTRAAALATIPGTAGVSQAGAAAFAALGKGVASQRELQGAHLQRSQVSLGPDGVWTLEVRGTPRGAGWAAKTQGLGVFGAGVVAGLLLFVVLQVLARSRGRALRLVDDRTAELRFQALHDGLTGLPNRVLIMDRAEQLLAGSRRDGEPVSALFIDLDGFKGVNDSFGHPAGDQLLVTVANRLQGVLREGDTVGRLGGDEFVVLTHGTSAGPQLVAERVLDIMREPFMLDTPNTSHPVTLISVTASIGIAVGLRAEAQDLLRDADIALYGAKAQGKDCYVVFQPEMHVAVTDRVALEMDLRGALAAGQLYLAYQPTVDLKDGAVTGVEALLRWAHPERGLIPPMDFIPVAEQSGLICELGRWVLDQACLQAAAWHAVGHTIDMSINLSGRQLDSADIVEDVRRALALSGMDARRLILEVTETTLMRDADASAGRLNELKALGARIAIDDFGTGYSSLAYLQRFPVDLLKIDRSFIAGLSGARESAGLVDTLVQLGKALGLGTLAEGIEDDAQLAYLKERDCDGGQGFLFARPLDPSAVERLFDRTPGPRAIPVARQLDAAGLALNVASP